MGMYEDAQLVPLQRPFPIGARSIKLILEQAEILHVPQGNHLLQHELLSFKK